MYSGSASGGQGTTGRVGEICTVNMHVMEVCSSFAQANVAAQRQDLAIMSYVFVVYLLVVRCDV